MSAGTPNYQGRYRAKNRGEIRARNREWMRRWRAANPEKALEHSRKTAARKSVKRAAARPSIPVICPHCAQAFAVPLPAKKARAA